MAKIDRNNNFDLIRLIAALQVVFFHSYEHLKINNSFVSFLSHHFLEFFPGVPIFFFISGFLIYASFERNRNNVKKYLVNRFLRIFPGLWVSVIISIIMISIDYNGESLFNFLISKDAVLWGLGQISFFQFYTPDSFRFWGVGTPNGSL